MVKCPLVGQGVTLVLGCTTVSMYKEVDIRPEERLLEASKNYK